MEGYVNIYRSIMDWGWYTTPGMHHLFTHLILRARFMDGTWQDKSLERGQLITSHAQLSRETGLSVKVIRLGLERLKKTGEITMKTTNQYTIITICNYDKYQGQCKMEGKQKTDERQRDAEQKATKEKRKKDRMVKHSTSADIRAHEEEALEVGADDKKVCTDIDSEVTEMRNNPI